MKPWVLSSEALRKALERGADENGMVQVLAEDCHTVEDEVAGANVVLGREPTVGEVYGIPVGSHGRPDPKYGWLTCKIVPDKEAKA